MKTLLFLVVTLLLSQSIFAVEVNYFWKIDNYFAMKKLRQENPQKYNEVMRKCINTVKSSYQKRYDQVNAGAAELAVKYGLDPNTLMKYKVTARDVQSAHSFCGRHVNLVNPKDHALDEFIFCVKKLDENEFTMDTPQMVANSVGFCDHIQRDPKVNEIYSDCLLDEYEKRHNSNRTGISASMFGVSDVCLEKAFDKN